MKRLKLKHIITTFQSSETKRISQKLPKKKNSFIQSTSVRMALDFSIAILR